MNLFVYNRVITFYNTFPYLYINLAFYRFVEEIYDGYTLELPMWLHTQWIKTTQVLRFLYKPSTSITYVASTRVFFNNRVNKLNRVLYISSVNYNQNRLVSTLVFNNLVTNNYPLKLAAPFSSYLWATLSLINQLNFLTKLIFLWNFGNHTSGLWYHLHNKNLHSFKKTSTPQIQMLVLHNLKNL
jgi:hypothetical protein